MQIIKLPSNREAGDYRICIKLVHAPHDVITIDARQEGDWGLLLELLFKDIAHAEPGTLWRIEQEKEEGK